MKIIKNVTRSPRVGDWVKLLPWQNFYKVIEVTYSKAVLSGGWAYSLNKEWIYDDTRK